MTVQSLDPSGAGARAGFGAGAVLRAAIARVLAPLDAARGRLFPFVPVFLGCGIGAYFALPAEPDLGVLAFLAAGAVAVMVLVALWPLRGGPLLIAAALVAAGVAAAGFRAHLVAAPVLRAHYYGPVEGRLVMVDRSVSGAVRLTLDRVYLPGMAPARTPARVRVSFHGDEAAAALVPGTRVITTASLSPPSGPVEPGGFDFRRQAWFERLGAVGYTRNPALAIAPAPSGAALAITRLRLRMSAAIRTALPGEPGGFVAAILTGDRSGVGTATTEALRASNLAHLLAISGLHMGLLTGLVYGGLRGTLALVPPVALRLPIRKIAALGALAAAAFYLALSGGNVATQRAFIMAAVMLGAILLDRRAISLRSVALAGTLILVYRPEALLSPGFQMSFAATAALVAVFAALRKRRERRMQNPGARMRRRWPSWAAGLWSVALCSLVAGIATAPVAAAHFHRMAEYGLAANLLAVPLMGTVVMPAAVLAALLYPLGLHGVALWIMELGVRWILGVAHFVAALDGAVRHVPAPPGWVLPMAALGALWLIIWRGRARLAGAAVCTLALAGWGMAERPLLLISQDASLVGVRTDTGRALTRHRGAGFTARNWLAADGDGADQPTAAARLAPPDRPPGFTFGGVDWVHLFGTGAEGRLAPLCTPGVVIVIAARLTQAPDGGCTVIDQGLLRDTGALALGAGGHWTSASALQGRRPWVPRGGRGANARVPEVPAPPD